MQPLPGCLSDTSAVPLHIVYLVGVLSSHVTCPGRAYMQAIKCVLWYSCKTSHYRLEFQADDSDNTLLIVYADLD